MTDFEQSRIRAEKLRAELEYHSKRYYEMDAPEIEDYEYDKHGYVDELDKINTPNKDECPCCFSKINVNDKECSYCGYKLK